VDLSSGIKITQVCMDVSPRPTVPVLHGSGDQNCDSSVAEAEATADDSNDEGEIQDVDLTVVGTALQTPQDEPS